jgi:hypothetical protein
MTKGEEMAMLYRQMAIRTGETGIGFDHWNFIRHSASGIQP